MFTTLALKITRLAKLVELVRHVRLTVLTVLADLTKLIMLTVLAVVGFLSTGFSDWVHKSSVIARMKKLTLETSIQYRCIIFMQLPSLSHAIVAQNRFYVSSVS